MAYNLVPCDRQLVEVAGEPRYLPVCMEEGCAERVSLRRPSRPHRGQLYESAMAHLLSAAASSTQAAKPPRSASWSRLSTAALRLPSVRCETAVPCAPRWRRAPSPSRPPIAKGQTEHERAGPQEWGCRGEGPGSAGPRSMRKAHAIATPSRTGLPAPGCDPEFLLRHRRQPRPRVPSDCLSHRSGIFPREPVLDEEVHQLRKPRSCARATSLRSLSISARKTSFGTCRDVDPPKASIPSVAPARAATKSALRATAAPLTPATRPSVVSRPSWAPKIMSRTPLRLARRSRVTRRCARATSSVSALD